MSHSTPTMSGPPSAPDSSIRTVRPRVDVFETADEFCLVADLPGTREEDVDLSIEQNVLTIQAVARIPEFENHRLRHQGFHAGEWKRSFRLSAAVDRKSIDAELRDGVLRIKLPKAETSLRQKIELRPRPSTDERISTGDS